MINAECGFEGDDASAKLFAYGPTIKVDVAALHAPGDRKSPETASIRNVNALVDTGAILCFIDDAVAATIGLLVVDRQVLSGISGHHEANVYLAEISIPSLRFTLTGRFAGVQLIAGGQPHGVLLGRKLLSSMVMNYDGLKGKATLTIPGAPPPPSSGTAT